jgi:hypothetical protein
MRESADDSKDSERPQPPDSSTPDEAPPTAPGGALVPPPREPPTALAASAEPPSPRRSGEPWRQPGWRARNQFERLANDILDAIDGFADRIASELGLR